MGALVGEDAFDTAAQIGNGVLGNEVLDHHVPVGVQALQRLRGVDRRFGQHVITFRSRPHNDSVQRSVTDVEGTPPQLADQGREAVVPGRPRASWPGVDVPGADHLLALTAHDIPGDALAVR